MDIRNYFKVSQKNKEEKQIETNQHTSSFLSIKNNHKNIKSKHLTQHSSSYNSDTSPLKGNRHLQTQANSPPLKKPPINRRSSRCISSSESDDVKTSKILHKKRRRVIDDTKAVEEVKKGVSAAATKASNKLENNGRSNNTVRSGRGGRVIESDDSDGSPLLHKWEDTIKKRRTANQKYEEVFEVDSDETASISDDDDDEADEEEEVTNKRRPPASKQSTPSRAVNNKRAYEAASSTTKRRDTSKLQKGRPTASKRLVSPVSKSSSYTSITQPSAASPLEGKKFVFTGVFDNFSRDGIIDKVKQLGGNVVSAVSGKTNYLVYGTALEDGRKVEEGVKYAKMKSLLSKKSDEAEAKMLTEEEFIRWMGEFDSVEAPSPKKETPPVVASNVIVDKNKREMKEGEAPQELWTEKYRPKSSKELIGNEEVLRRLKSWLQQWQAVWLNGSSKKGEFRGALLSGPPGIGKTTAARIVAEECGYAVLEFNASDQRNKSSIEHVAEMATGGYTLTSGSVAKTCVMLDEIDGLSGGDRGGSQAMVKLLEKSLCPLICICNDRMSTKVRGIANKCYDLKMTRPPHHSIAKQISKIVKNEELDVHEGAIEVLCESVGNDLRQILNTLQFMKQSKSTVDVNDAQQQLKLGTKDQQVMWNAFSVLPKLLTASESSKMQLNQCLDAFFVDYDLLPLLMNENYLSSVYKCFDGGDRSRSYCENLERLSIIADDFAMADIVSTSIRKNQEWGLLSDFGILCCVDPSYHCRKMNAFKFRSDFPKWFGKNSTTNKNKRLLGELKLTLASKTTCSMGLKVSGYSDLLFKKCISPLTKTADVKAAAEKVLSFMSAYSIPRELMVESLKSLKLRTEENEYEAIDSKTKAAFTRICNSMSSQITKLPSKKQNYNQTSSTLFASNPSELEESKLDVSEESDGTSDVELTTKIETNKKKKKNKFLKTDV